VSPTDINITLQTPPHTTLRVDLASLGTPSNDHISIDNKSSTADQVENGFVVLPSGKHTVHIER
jgi:hypothetical protein